jgi:hypothetical protein
MVTASASNASAGGRRNGMQIAGQKMRIAGQKMRIAEQKMRIADCEL